MRHDQNDEVLTSRINAIVAEIDNTDGDGLTGPQTEAVRANILGLRGNRDDRGYSTPSALPGQFSRVEALLREVKNTRGPGLTEPQKAVLITRLEALKDPARGTATDNATEIPDQIEGGVEETTNDPNRRTRKDRNAQEAAQDRASHVPSGYVDPSQPSKRATGTDQAAIDSSRAAREATEHADLHGKRK